MGYELNFDTKNYKFSVENEKRQKRVDEVAENFKKSFHKMPEKAQDIYIDAFFNLVCKDKNVYDDIYLFREVYTLPSVESLIKCQSPIEIMLLCSLDLVSLYYAADFGLDFDSQYELNINGSKRIMDIAVRDSETYKILFFVECDGFEFHARTKEQFEYTNKKDREVRAAGYDLLHFTGTEIYNNPLKCAWEIVNYGRKKLEKTGN